MRSILPALLLVGFVAAPTLAKDAKPADPDKKSCRRVEQTGTILGGRLVCHTNAEWSAIDQANSDATRALREPMRAPARPGL